MTSQVSTNEVVRPRELARRLGIAVPTVYRWIAAGTLPAPRRLGPATTAWLAREVEEWLATRPRTDEHDDGMRDEVGP